MKIDFENVRELYPAGKIAIPKGQGKYFCPCCKKTLGEKNFFKTSWIQKHPSGYIPECKTCVSMTIVDTDPATFLSLLKELNLPYMPSVWRGLVAKKESKAGSIIGKYASMARINQYKKYNWSDSEKLVEEETKSLLDAMRQVTENETEAQEKVEEMLSFSDITPTNTLTVDGGNGIISAGMYQLVGLTPETSQFGLTQEEIDELKIAWGKDYSEEDFLGLEQLFTDMKTAYVINDPVALSNAKMICKMTMKMNKFLDIDDIESVSKISRQLDMFIKTANLAPVQQKDRQSSTFAISQLAYLVEKEGGFISKWDTSVAMDNIDMMMQDLQNYTQALVLGENNINEMAKNTAEILKNDLPEAELEDFSDFEALEAEVLGDIKAIEEPDELEGDDEDAVTN